MSKRYAIILVRVSSYKQDYDAQVKDLTEYAKAKGYTDFHLIDTTESGLVDLNQKVGANLMFKHYQENTNYNTVFATEISRLGRRLSILELMKEWFLNNHVQLYIKDNGYQLFVNDKIEPSNGLMFSLYGMFAENEIKQRKERFLRSRRELMKLGYSIGGRTLFGYDKHLADNKKNTLIINEENAIIIRTIFNWYIDGITESGTTIVDPSIKRITLTCIEKKYPRYTHSKRNVNKLLKEEGYTGYKTTSNKRKNHLYGKVDGVSEYVTSNYEIKYPPIISKTLFDEVQKKLKLNISKANRDTKHTTILAKLIKCSACGRSLSANYRNYGNYPKHSYRCTSRSGATPCSNTKSVSMQLIDNAIWSLVKADLPALSKIISELNPDVEKAKLEASKANIYAKKVEYDDEVKRILRRLKIFMGYRNLDMETDINELHTRLSKIDKEKGALEGKRLSIDSNLLMVQDKLDDIHGVVMANLDAIEASKELLKRYINYFVVSIHVLKQNVPYSTLKITFKQYTEPDFFELVTEKDSLPTSKDVYLLMDKRITRDIKLARDVHYPMAMFKDVEQSGIDERLEKLEENVAMRNNDKLTFVPYTKLDAK